MSERYNRQCFQRWISAFYDAFRVADIIATLDALPMDFSIFTCENYSDMAMFQQWVNSLRFNEALTLYSNFLLCGRARMLRLTREGRWPI